MKIPFTPAEIEKATVDLIRKNKIKSGYIRPISYFGYGKMGLNPKGSPVNTVIAAWPWGSYLGEKPIKCKISDYMRIHPKSTFADAKICGHYVNSILASLEIHKKGYDEAILLDYKENVAEGPGENIFIIKKGILITPPKGNILTGITRDSIMQIAKKNNIKSAIKAINKKELLQADEAFFSGTAAEVTPIASIDRKKIGTGNVGPFTKIIKEKYLSAVRGEYPAFEKWLTYIK
jgi:branched-chain amino acid aminotransferase